jgi:hypothetical protein
MSDKNSKKNSNNKLILLAYHGIEFSGRMKTIGIWPEAVGMSEGSPVDGKHSHYHQQGLLILISVYDMLSTF